MASRSSRPPAQDRASPRANSRPKLVAVIGPTASGKTGIAERLADLLGAQLINADAFQVYRGMDIGTAKPQAKDRYLLLDLKDPREAFGAGEWVRLACGSLRRLWSESRSAVIVGGTGFYTRALLERYTDLQGPPPEELRAELMAREAREGLPALAGELARIDPDAAARVDPRNPVRVRRALERALHRSGNVPVDLPPFDELKIGVDWDVRTLDARIETRAHALIASGWVAEVRGLLADGVPRNAPGMRAIGYSPLASYLGGDISLDGAIAQIVLATRQYAKRQRTWMRSEPRLFRLPRQSGETLTDRELLALLAKARTFEHGEDDQPAGHVS